MLSLRFIASFNLKFYWGYSMKKLFASASILVLGSVAASAADLPMKAAPMVAPVPVFSWSGCYIGGHVGGGTQHDSWTQDNLSFLGVRSGFGNNGTGTGGLAGGQLGCNYQDGNAVFGLEGEGYWSGIRTSTGFSAPGEGFTLTTKNKDDFSIAARVGIAFDRTLVYGKAGWVWGDFDFGATSTCCGTFATTDIIAGSKQLNGLLIGVGIEHAFARNWTVKLEYNFLDFGSGGVNFTECAVGGGCAPFTITTTEHASKQIFKVGFNYLFPVWGYAPVVAKY
jgi:outer membrane immunogenic protein